MGAPVDRTLVFLDLQSRAARAKTLGELAFLCVNQTMQLVPYQQAVFWCKNDIGIILQHFSGQAVADKQSPYAIWLRGVIAARLERIEENDAPVFTLGEADFATAEDVAQWRDFSAPSMAMMVFFDLRGKVIGGLWLERAAPFTPMEMTVLQEIQAIYSACAALHTLNDRGSWMQFLRDEGRRKYILAAAVFAVLCPVPLSVSVPAEIVARGAGVVTIPYDGVLEAVKVQVGETVKAGDIVAVMEREQLQAKADLAQQELSKAQQNLSHMRREAITTPEKKPQLKLLEAEIKTRSIDYDFAAQMMLNSDMKAPNDGIAVFSDVNDIEGKPFRTGEVVMQIADPAQYEVLAQIPVEAMVPLPKDAKVVFYPHARPLSGYRGTVVRMGYQASPDPDGLLTYKIRSSVEDADALVIGWKGTAKISGGWTVLSYAVLRRPLVALRGLIGL